MWAYYPREALKKLPSTNWLMMFIDTCLTQVLGALKKHVCNFELPRGTLVLAEDSFDPRAPNFGCIGDEFGIECSKDPSDPMRAGWIQKSSELRILAGEFLRIKCGVPHLRIWA